MFGSGTVGRDITTHAQGDPNNQFAGYIDDVAWGKTIPVNQAQFDAMTAKIEDWNTTKPDYNVFGTNCTAFVRDVLSAGDASYPGITFGPNPFSLIPVGEQGALFTTDSNGQRVLSDAVRNPSATMGTPAFEDAQQRNAKPADPKPASQDPVSYDEHQNPDGSWTFTTRYADGSKDYAEAASDTAKATAYHEDYGNDPASGNPYMLKTAYSDGFNSVPDQKTYSEFIETPSGTSHTDTVTTYVDGVASTVRNTYDADNQLYKSETVPTSTVGAVTQQAVTVLQDVGALISAIQGGKPVPILTSGLRLANSLTSGSIPGLATANGVVSGLASLYNLSNALKYGNGLTKLNATLSTLNYVNSVLRL